MTESRELEFVGGGKLDHLYTHHFSNGAGKFFNVLTTEEGNLAIEYEEPSAIRNRLKMTLTFIKDRNQVEAVTFKRFKFYKNRGWEEQYFGPHDPFKLSHFSFQKLVGFLQLLTELDLANVNERRIALVEANAKGIDPDTERKVRSILIQPDGQRIVEELVKSGLITSHDIVNVGFRKGQLEVFRRLLSEDAYVTEYADEHGLRLDQPEKAWQHFFSRNDWIFGFGLDYRFLGILQAEAHLGTEDLAGRDGVIGDFLLGATNFTVLVEIKRPDTPIFTQSMSRANSWQLSRDVVSAVSQILEQKASWQIKSEVHANRNFDDTNALIRQRTLDPKCLLVLGSDKMIVGKREKSS